MSRICETKVKRNYTEHCTLLQSHFPRGLIKEFWNHCAYILQFKHQINGWQRVGDKCLTVVMGSFR